MWSFCSLILYSINVTWIMSKSYSKIIYSVLLRLPPQYIVFWLLYDYNAARIHKLILKITYLFILSIQNTALVKTPSHLRAMAFTNNEVVYGNKLIVNNSLLNGNYIGIVLIPKVTSGFNKCLLFCSHGNQLSRVLWYRTIWRASNAIVWLSSAKFC